MPPELTRPIALVAGAAASFAAALEFDASGRTVAAVFFLSVLAVLSAIDVEERRIPNRIVLPAAAVMLGLQIALEPGRALEWTAAALGAGALLLVLARIHPAGLGLGDVKLALLLGAALGGGVLAALALGSLLAGVFGVGARHPARARRPQGDGPARAVPGRRRGRRAARFLGEPLLKPGKPTYDGPGSSWKLRHSTRQPRRWTHSRSYSASTASTTPRSRLHAYEPAPPA